MTHPQTGPRPSPFRWLRKIVGFLSVGLIALFALVTACGDGGSSNGGVTPPTAEGTVVQINLGDAPADWVLAFATTITSVTVHGSDGSYAIVTTPVPVELMQHMGTFEPLALGLANQATYTSATVNFGDCNVTYIDPDTKTLQERTIAGPFSVDVPFGSGVNLGTTPLAFNFDLDLNHSLSLTNAGQFAFSPNFHFSFGAQGGGNGSGNGMGPFFGGMQHMFGVVSSIGNGYMVMTSLQAMNTFTIQTNAQTQFRGLATSLSQLTAGMGVWVNASLQSDGTLLASRINAMMRSGGIMGGGIVTQIDQEEGAPATQITIVMQNGAGASINTDLLSKTLTVNLTADTTYSIDDDRVDLSSTSLPFTPVFDASHILLGQSVLPVDDSGNLIPGDATSAGTITASSVSLKERGFRGTTDTNLTPGTATTFTLTLPTDCAFTTLTGATTITVYQQTGTNLQYQTAIPAGSTVRVHGLLFRNEGQWVLVASTIASTTSTT